MHRTTDYPVGRKPRPKLMRPPSNSETDSTSTYSENSDSSYVHDGSKQPKKKILKETGSMRRRKSKNRVRWNLGSSENADLISVASFHSVSVLDSDRSFHSQSHRGAFDRLSPIRGGSLRSSYTQGRSPSPSFSPSRNVTRPSDDLYRTHSQDMLNQGLRKPYVARQLMKGATNSTPIRNGRLYHQSLQNFQEDESEQILNVPVFVPDENNIPSLEDSTQEDKHKLFEIPQQTRGTLRVQRLSVDDDDDYDHLPDKRKQGKSGGDGGSGWYSERDIDNALQELNQEELHNGVKPHPTSMKSHGYTTSRHSPPPPPPPPLKQPIVPSQQTSSPPSTRKGFPPPVPERKSSLTNKSTFLTTKDHNPPDYHFSEDDLKSQSCDTLIDEAPSTQELSPQSSDDPLTPVEAEVYPASSTYNNHVQSSWGTAFTIQERIVEGAEDPDRSSSTTPLPANSKKKHFPSPPRQRNGLGHLQVKEEPARNTSSMSSALQQYKTRVLSFSTNNLTSYHNPPPYKLCKNRKLPKPLNELPPDEQEWFHRINSGHGPHMTRAVSYDTDKEISALLAELNGRYTPPPSLLFY